MWRPREDGVSVGCFIAGKRIQEQRQSALQFRVAMDFVEIIFKSIWSCSFIGGGIAGFMGRVVRRSTAS